MSDDWVRIGGSALSAAINPLGAELSSLKDEAGREFLWQGDPAWWGGRAPILFPVVGKPAGETIRVRGQAYPMKQHGFARRRRFEVVDAGTLGATFELVDDAETRASYPFAFALRVRFDVIGRMLRVTATLANPGEVPLPASFGFHPAFACPLPGAGAREDHRIRFAAPEPQPIRVLDADGQVAPGTRATPVEGRELPLRDDLFARDALIWDRIASDGASYGTGRGPRVEIGFGDAPMLGVWSKPGAPFVCIEPWHGVADPAGYAGAFADKPGVFEVAAGAEREIAMTITLA